MEFMEEINQKFRDLKKPNLNEISNALKQISYISPYLIEPFIKAPEQFAYGRNVIYRNNALEVILINLPPNTETAIHDHGKSIGCAIVLEGEMVNSIYRFNEDEVEKTASYHVTRGDCIYSAPALIHKMSNFNEERMVSLHVYSPPLQDMVSYEECKNMFISFTPSNNIQ